MIYRWREIKITIGRKGELSVEIEGEPGRLHGKCAQTIITQTPQAVEIRIAANDPERKARR